MSAICMQVKVSGKVQGVGFRQAAVQQATKLSIDGWVRNEDDGTVSALLCGNTEAVEAMLAWLGKGPSSAQVGGLAASSCAWQDIAGFVQL
ncbi:MAG TPA: acylphosphatase [Pseudomonas sabulinigri]|uniref:Acylphosphatase-like domain-containing protein n=1 Tax=marine sediment metagenome TaxID=412755 RepID=A0A0F9XG17_9ZZZZ|nr:acylphosphatase [Halopseudomonas sabulinigri]HEC51098.1 acylphosphatase [Halopseudomonas sabulinigri]